MSKVLVIEDDQAYSKALAVRLRKNGHEPLLAKTAEEAIETVDTTRGDFGTVIVDLRLPGGGGLDLVKRLRQHGVKCLVVILSAYVENGKLEGWEHLDVFDVINKGNSINKVIRRIEAAVDMSENMHYAMALLKTVSKNGAQIAS